ncbi:ECF transporter S component [Ornithinibacillus xuwenensis]|uniref:ECF transporter S component n=1 Tax=Ornithinibacillus xuwenensis TaxID=3144668 RepID=A0ABU9XD23_9BACI
MNIYKITLIALLATLAIVGRVAVSFIPSVQPVTSIIIISGIFLGPVSGILLAILVTFLSNMLLGTGIWTVWQIITWGLIGLISGIIGKYTKKFPLYVVVLFAVFCGYFYGFVVSLVNYQVTGQGFLAYYLAGLPFDTNHAIGNAAFMILLYPAITFIFNNYITKHLKK